MNRKEESRSSGITFSGVKRLLETGLLEGISVKYVFKKYNVEVQGLIKGDGYKCGCSSCNYTKVLTAYEFERHAGVESSHPNNHILLKNGRSLHEVVKSLESSSLESLPNDIQGLISCPVNLKLYNTWRKGFSQRASHKAKQTESDEESLPESSQTTSELDEESLPYSFRTRGRDLQRTTLSSKTNQRFVPKLRENSTISTIEAKRAHQWLSDDRHGVESLNLNEKIDVKINGNFSPSSRLSNVKGLLSTGLLEGVQVIYKKDGEELLRGNVKDLGYQCGCSSCNYTKVLSALVFERHAGATTKNQNNHVFVESGKSIYGLVKELFDSPLGSLGEVIEEKIGCRANMKRFEDWKDSFQSERHELQKTSISTLPKPHSAPHSVKSTMEAKRAHQCFSGDGHGDYPPPGKNHGAESLNDGVVLKTSCGSEDLDPCAPNEKIDAKINGNFCPSSRLNNVKGLLSTGLLEGVQVIYKKDDEELLRGNIKDLGYQCGCSSCNYTKVLSALEFEKHAGATTNNQNNHVFIESGKSIYGLVKELFNSPLGSLGEVIEEKIGCRANMKRFEDWKDSFQSARYELQKTSVNGVESICTSSKPHNEPHSVKSTMEVKRAHQCFSDDCHGDYPSPSKNYEAESLNDGVVLKSSHGSEDPDPCAPNEKIDAKINGNFCPSSRLNNVKGLLSTGLLEGVQVIYKKDGEELLRGNIKDLGYQCGCSSCNYTKVLSALEFEKHAGATTNNQNDHVYIESGKSIYGLVKELFDSPLGSLGEVIEEKIGCRANMKRFEDWKDSFQSARHELQKTSMNGVEILRTSPKPHSAPHSVKSSLGPATEGSFDPGFQWPATVSNSDPVSSTNGKFSFQWPATEGSFDPALISNLKISSTWPAVEGNINTASSILISPSKTKHSVLESKLEYGKRIANMPPSAPSLQEATVAPVKPKTPVQGGAKKRDNDLHRVIFMENGLPDGTELAYCLKGQILLKGFKLDTGILCVCCRNKVSPSQFEAHAGCSARRQPYRNIYTSNGLSLHEISISLSNGQNLTYICTEDKCTICGSGGDLIPCDGCSKAFHAVCLKLQCQPNGEWHCPYCKDNLGSETTSSVISSSAVRPITLRLRRILKVPTDEFGGCVLCKGYSHSLKEFNAKTIILCCQCEKEYHVGCLKDHGLFDLKEHPRIWFCSVDCDVSHAGLRNLVFQGPKPVPESILSRLKRKIENKGLNNEPGADVQWQLLSGKRQSSELLLSKASAIFQDAFYPIAHRGHDLIPAMIHGKDVAGQYFEGMYCAILTVRSVIVSAGILRVFGCNVAELPLVATPKDSQGKGYFQALLSVIEGLLGLLKVEVLMLPVADNEQSMWINKFGFVKMTEERLHKYAMEHPMLMFEKTTVLEKTITRYSER